MDPMNVRRIAFVTGTLAEPALRRMATQLADETGLEPIVVVLNIQVAALMTTSWVSRKLDLPSDRGIDRVILPGYCRGDLEPLRRKLGVPVERGPRQIHDLPTALGRSAERAPEYGSYDIEIVAEINDASRLSLQDTLAEADRLRNTGADIIDVGCDPNVERPAWAGLGDTTAALREHGHRVSVDSFHPEEIKAACAAGAELVLSVNATNRHEACEWGTEVVAIPDTPADLDSLDRTIEYLDAHSVPFRADPIVEPIGFGFAAALGRYLETRRRHRTVPMMMGIGNMTEMTEVDSAGVNALLIGFCQELNVSSVLTTQVINWSRSAVREIDIARRLMHHAITYQTVPKHLDPRLVMLRDPKLHAIDERELADLASKLTDRNIRIYADTVRGRLHAMNDRTHVESDEPFDLFEKLGVDDPSHAFYLGYEMAKAVTALELGKNYVQDEPLDWGLLTRED